MMNNLFNMFDPTSLTFNLKFNWLSMLITLFLLQYNLWILNNPFNKFINIMLNLFYKEMKTMIIMNKPIIMFISIMMVIFINNFMGLFPYIFTSTSHIMISFFLSLLLWLTFNIYGWIINTSSMLTHLVPMGTPVVLMPFMVIIESISNMIRPITLSVRLMANMTAGHLLISLMSSICEKMNLFMNLIIIMLQMLLMMLELAVALIQSYVFTTLSSLYYNEMN
uniref:ATP synthase subunit a n=1 Tax=Ammothea carolinensis TaxID=648471 RepID=E3SHE8_AMMCA|nr:ATP synthase F0 subunit 6 [Ammothea carolinensis]ACY00253.1 ATP synthase F0 subunit 6 [Ammothea carolinensis]